MSLGSVNSDETRERGFRLFETYRTYLLTVAQCKIGARLIGPKSASDFVQDSLLAAVAAEERGLGPKAAEDDRRRYLGGILRNQINAALRREMILTRREGADDATPGSGPEPPDEAIKDERARRMRDALERLSPEDRQLVDWILDGVKRREIGERLGVSGPYASQLCKRATKCLREAYSEGGDSSGC